MALAKATMDYTGRLARIRELMAAQDIDLLFVPPSAALQYLTGLKRPHPSFGNSNHNGGWVHALLVAQKSELILSLPRMSTLFATFPSSLELAILQDTADPQQHMKKLLESFGQPIKTIAVESRTWGQAVLELQKLLPDARFVNADPLFTQLRRIKTPEEIEVMREAAAIIDQTHQYIVSILRPGLAYHEIVAELNRKMVELGAETQSFPTTLIPMGEGVGPGADPWSAGGAKDRSSGAPFLQNNSSLSFDYGSVVDGYCNDYGRSVWIGEPPADYLKIYDLVISAQEEARAAMKAGKITGEAANQTARQVVEAAGYGPHFFHRLGHGIGLDVHEPCYLSEGDATTLEANMTFTIEPSIFIPNKFGARIEDVFVVTADGAEPLNRYPRELQVIS